MHRPTSPKCFFVAWIGGWFLAIYAPSALIAFAGLSPLAHGRSVPAATFAIADQVAPAAKILFALLFAAMLFAARRVKLRRSLGIALDMALSCLAMLAVLALLPADWSRGFGIGLTGARFTVAPLLIYLAGALLAGLGFSLSEASCVARSATGSRAAGT